VDLSAIAAFAGVATLLTVTPGADMALVTRAALARGRGEAFAVTLGIVCGLMAWATASALGVAALLAASATAFTVLKLAGAAYLVALGIHALLTAGRAPEPVPEPRRGRSSFAVGLVTNLLNPKIAVFYSTLLPQFIASGDPVLATSLAMAAVHGALSIVWLSAYAWAVTAMGDVLRRERVRRALDRVTGVVLVGLGAGLLLERR
jgi:threonine/homoserine/homoserine lactone efflux protein